ncbi:MAG TPA: PLP-dependent aminotransferase family protein [Solirubrobacteraceae bacterium]|jgi:GntR family transcriptional regulator/MocR family aminotransferase
MDLHLDLESAEGRSLRARIEHALREAVRSGRLPPGTRLPATRRLCVELGVSRGVVAEAYAQLAAEGYLQTHRGAGTLVAATGGGQPASASHAPQRAQPRHDLNPFRPALAAFPRGAWATAIARVARSAPDESLGYPDPAGVPELRSALAAYLGRARGVRATPEQIAVVSGLRQGISLVFSALAAQGAKSIALEQPGWHGLHETAADAGLRTERVPVDREGLLVDELERLHIDAVTVMPAHQYPTGAVLSAERRAALIEWAQRHDAIVIEDDYDAEYRYDRRPIGSLQGLAPQRVVYGGSASKTLAPALRLGWLALPQDLATRVIELQRVRSGMPAPLLQLAFADLIERGELDRHLRSQRRRYGRQREALLAALQSAFPEAAIRGAAAGLYLVLELPAGIEERHVLDAARRRGIAVAGLGDSEPGLVIGYANLPEPSVAPAVQALSASIAEARVGSALRGDARRQDTARHDTRV